ncbi:hypothetical protein L0F63_007461 [Massospora cicadina]|nr:hypothetical protein L0F63_007461 [Massospora cicadina]
MDRRDLLSVLDFGDEFGNQQHSAPPATGDGFTSVVFCYNCVSLLVRFTFHVSVCVSLRVVALLVSSSARLPLVIDGLSVVFLKYCLVVYS